MLQWTAMDSHALAQCSKTSFRSASKGVVVGVTTPALFGKDRNFALFSSGQSGRLLNVLFE